MNARIASCLLILYPAGPNIGFAAAILGGELETLISSDVGIYSGYLQGSFEFQEGTLLDLRLESLHHELDYQPNEAIDPFGRPTKLEDTLAGFDLALEHTRNRHRTALSLSGYAGFRSYTAIWIDEYYRQQYSGGGIPGVQYEDPDPSGLGVSLAHRYELAPATAFLSASVAFLRDRVAPGYEIADLGSAFELIRGETLLSTWTGSVDYETVLNRKARMRHSLRVTATTTREARYSWSGALNTSISQRWISRSTASFAIENPDFEAYSLSQTFEYAVSDLWSVSMTVRYYEDSGQIELANLVSSAAPALTTKQAFLALRWSSNDGESGLSVSIGPYFSDYAATGIGTERFSGLYEDRDWWWCRVAFRKSF